MTTSYLTIGQYSTEKHGLFTHQFVKVGDKIIVIYKNNGYTSKSSVYGSIFEIDLKDRNILKFKTKKQVITYLSKLN